MTTKKLDAIDFMMMDVHRQLTNEEISAINPQAGVDKSLRLVENDNSEAEGVGAPHEEERPEDRGYRGPFVNYPDNVAVADVATCHELDVNRVLQAAYDSGLSTVMVIGVHDDGEVYVLCSDPDVAQANLLCDRAKMHFLDELKQGKLREATNDPKDRA
jgi:hypothetical protein